MIVLFGVFHMKQSLTTAIDKVFAPYTTQNAFVESFNARFRDTCLNQHWFRDLEDARQIISAWRDSYNHVRPHSSLGCIPPAVFAQQAA